MYERLLYAEPLKLLQHRHMGRPRFIGKVVYLDGAYYYVTLRDEGTRYRKHNSYGITRQVLDALWELKLSQGREVYVAILNTSERKVYLSRLWDWLNSPLKVRWAGEEQVHLPIDKMKVLE